MENKSFKLCQEDKLEPQLQELCNMGLLVGYCEYTTKHPTKSGDISKFHMLYLLTYVLGIYTFIPHAVSAAISVEMVLHC